jgi:4-amino-4-deoxy-L-arabinose transferase-like glycosyltransferase
MQQRQQLLGAGDRVKSATAYGTILIVAACTAWHFWAAGHAGLVPDETYYWLWSRFPSFGYYDHPPMVAWLIAGGTKLFGDTAFGIRFWFVAILPLTSLITYQTGRLLFDSPAIASLATIWFNASILIGVGGIFATPDGPSVLFWSLAVLALALVCRTGHSAWWLAVGAAAGLGAISKYTNLFFGLGVLALIIVDRRERRWLLDPWAWAAALIAILIFLPVFIWNAQHHWMSFAKQFGRLVPHGIHLRFIPEFVLAQTGLLNPIVAVFVVMAVVAYLRRRGDPNGAIGFLVTLSAPLVLYMLLHSIHDRVQGNWLAPIYPTLALLAAAIAVPLGERNETPRLLRRLRVTATPLGLAVSVIALSYLAIPLDVFGSKDPSQLTRGWPQFADEIEALRLGRNAEWIATAGYSLTGELAFHLRSRSPVREIAEQQRYTFEPPLRYASMGQRAILVLRSDHARSKSYKNCFKHVTPIGPLDRVAARHSLEKYMVYLAVRPRAALGDGACAKKRRSATKRRSAKKQSS